MTKLYTKAVTSCRECGNCDVAWDSSTGWCHEEDRVARDCDSVPEWCPLPDEPPSEPRSFLDFIDGGPIFPVGSKRPDEQPHVEIRAGTLSAAVTVDSEAKLHGLHELMGQQLPQARCRECNVPLDGVTAHEKGCDYPRWLAEARRGMTPKEQMPKVTSTCDICGKESEPWTAWWTCRECCGTVCNECVVPYSELDGETGRAVCTMCAEVPMDEPLQDAGTSPEGQTDGKP